MNMVFLSHNTNTFGGAEVVHSPYTLKPGQGRALFHEGDPREAALAKKFFKLFAHLIIDPTITEQPTNGECILSTSTVTKGCATVITLIFNEKVKNFMKNNKINGVYIPK